MLVSRRYERAVMIVTSNKPFSAWGEIFGDDMAATAMVDRLIHHAEILSLKGDTYRLKDRDLGPRLDPDRRHPIRGAGGISLRSPTARCAKRRRRPGAEVAYFSTGANHRGSILTGATGSILDRPRILEKQRRPPHGTGLAEQNPCSVSASCRRSSTPRAPWERVAHLVRNGRVGQQRAGRP